jgi:hypothetical protein
VALVRADQPGVTIVPMPETAFVPEVPHARIHLQDVAIDAASLLPGDGYSNYVKPFRTLEDTFVTAAVLAYLLREARARGWPADLRERLSASLVGLGDGGAVAPRCADHPCRPRRCAALGCRALPRGWRAVGHNARRPGVPPLAQGRPPVRRGRRRSPAARGARLGAASVREIRRCVQELGFKAIRVLPWLWELPPTDRRFYPVYTACCELGVPFCTQIGHTGPLMPSEVGRPIYLDRVALDFPELVIVGGHIGYPWTEEAIAVATKHENVYIDTSAYTARRYPAALVEFMRGHGRHKVLFGTNYPMFTPAKALDGLEELGLDGTVQDLFLASNAQA